MLTGSTSTPSYPLQTTLEDQEITRGFVTPILEFGTLETDEEIKSDGTLIKKASASTVSNKTEDDKYLLVASNIRLAEWVIRACWFLIILVLIVLIYKILKRKNTAL